MAKHNAFQFELNRDLTDAFLDAAKSAQREPEEVIEALVRDFVDQQNDEPGYVEFLNKKVAAARRSSSTSIGRSSEEVDALFEQMRKAVQKSAR